jgi:uncharacterized membrane protein
MTAAAPHGASPIAARPPVETAMPDEDHDLLLEAGIAALVVIGIIAGFVFLLRWLRGPRRMSERRREDFVAKLRSVLDEGEGHAASQT